MTHANAATRETMNAVMSRRDTVIAEDESHSEETIHTCD